VEQELLTLPEHLSLPPVFSGVCNGKKKKVPKDKQRSTKHTYKTKAGVTQTPLKTGGKLRCSGRVSSSCSSFGTFFFLPLCCLFFFDIQILITHMVSSSSSFDYKDTNK
jgi:hypothetical protein